MVEKPFVCDCFQVSVFSSTLTTMKLTIKVCVAPLAAIFIIDLSGSCANLRHDARIIALVTFQGFFLYYYDFYGLN